MKISKNSFWIALVFFCIFQCILYSPAKAEDLLCVDTILKNIDPDKVNKAQVKEYFKDIDGRTAKGEGKIINVLPSNKDNHRLRILTSASNPEKGYNVMLFTTQNAPAELSPGDMITFEGKISRINAFQGASLDIYGTYQKKPAGK